ncbi:hypothetical protein [Larsenimonas salina]|uniref:hypothetical protein n=1 Tax=Larsenimonas salina TaxID=1295565 RepID=UPI002072D872|nr:hypothetical protein [Larsenimonas salina]MCM5704429.1 hypothetical protein [Larsenimonas salina]
MNMLKLSGAALASVMMVSLAQAAPPKTPDNPMVKECMNLAVKDSPKLEGLPYGQDNIDDYTQGEPFDLEVTLYGQGNALLNLKCNVDESGSVSYKGHDRNGSWAD